MAIALRIGRVTQEKQHAGVTELPKPLHVGRQAVRGRRGELEVARVDDPADRSFNREGDRVGDRVADGDGLNPERAELHRVPHPHLAQIGFAQDPVLPELRLDESERETRPVDGDVELPQSKWQSADVVLVPVREEDAEDLAIPLQEVRDVRQHEVDAEHVFLREHEPGVDDEDLVLPLQRPHVDADLAQATKREIPELRGHKRRNCSDSGLGTATGTGGGGGASSWSRYRRSWSKSCSRSATSDPLWSAAAGW